VESLYHYCLVESWFEQSMSNIYIIYCQMTHYKKQYLRFSQWWRFTSCLLWCHVMSCSDSRIPLSQRTTVSIFMVKIVSYHATTRHHNPEDHNLRNYNIIHSESDTMRGVTAAYFKVLSRNLKLW